MIWHFLEVWVLVLGAFVIGCTMGAVLHDLLAQSSYATAQGALADSVGDVVDRLKDRLGVGAVWRPEHRRIIAHAGAESVYDEPGRDEPHASPHDADGALIPGWADDQQGREVVDLDVDADWQEQMQPAAEQDPLTEPVRELPEPLREPSREPAATGKAASASGEPETASLPDEGIVPMRPAGLAEPRNGVPDNLQRIRGVGERNEVRLNTLGIFHFGQIAAWTPAEMRWVSQHLAFPERIERDDWIGQAIVLASGGDTGFTKSAERRRARRQQESRSAAEPGDDAGDESAES